MIAPQDALHENLQFTLQPDGHSHFEISSRVSFIHISAAAGGKNLRSIAKQPRDDPPLAVAKIGFAVISKDLGNALGRRPPRFPCPHRQISRPRRVATRRPIAVFPAPISPISTMLFLPRSALYRLEPCAVLGAFSCLRFSAACYPSFPFFIPGFDAIQALCGLQLRPHRLLPCRLGGSSSPNCERPRGGDHLTEFTRFMWYARKRGRNRESSAMKTSINAKLVQISFRIDDTRRDCRRQLVCPGNIFRAGDEGDQQAAAQRES